MAENQFCEKCSLKNKCGDVYQRLGQTRGPSVVLKVVVAFLLPIVVFAVSAALSEHMLAERIINERARTAVSFLIAIAAVLAVVFATRVIKTKLDK